MRRRVVYLCRGSLSQLCSNYWFTSATIHSQCIVSITLLLSLAYTDIRAPICCSATPPTSRSIRADLSLESTTITLVSLIAAQR